MQTFIWIVLLAIIFFLFISIMWRFLSKKFNLPHPSCLSWMVDMENPFIKANRASTIIPQLELQPDMHVLDAGCGPGRLTIPMAEKIGPKGEVTALDIQQEMLNKVQEKACAKSLHNIRYLQAGLGQGNLEQNKYDRAILISVLGEIPDQLTALKELFNALKPGGFLSITEVIADPHFQRQNTVRALAKAAGFQEKNLFGNRFAYTMQLYKME